MSRRALLSSIGSLVFGCFVLSAQDTKADDKIHDLVMVRLAGDQEIGGAGRIEVSVSNGVVTLTGRIESDKQKARAEHLAKKVKGVKSVDNQIKVEPR
ncbi:MAG TPA: BON domain-containing protein [Bryobacteraceae bacterium]|jgi:osmotically-inducible protein OsmY